MSTIFLVIFIIILVRCDTTVVTYGRTESVTPRSSRLGEDSESLESGTSEKLAPFASQGSRSNFTVFHHFWENEPRETHASSTSDQATEISLNASSSNAVQDEEKRLQLMRRRRDMNEASSSSFQMTRLATAMKAIELENTQLKSTVKELQTVTKSMATKEQESNFVVSQVNAALQQQQLAIGQLQLQLSQLSTNTMKLQDENEALRAQMRLRMEDPDSRHEQMQSMMMVISNLTTKLQAENSSIYSQLLKVLDLTSGLQAENSSIYLQLLKVSDLMSGLQSENSSIYSQLQALSSDFIERRTQYEDQLTALHEKVRMLQTQTTNLDTHLSKRNSALEEQLRSQVTQLQQKDQELVQMVVKRTSVDAIGFHAKLTNDVDAPTTRTLVLDSVYYNAGGGYDSTTGIFTAPVTGLYLLLATIAAPSGNITAKVSIEVNGRVTGCFSKYSTNIELCTCHGAVRVEKGQQMRIVTDGNNRRIRGGRWTKFTVVLIQREG